MLGGDGRVEQGLFDVRRGVRLSPRDRRLGKGLTLLAGCLLRAGHPAEALSEARLAYLADPSIYMAKLIEALAAHRLGQRREARQALGVVAEAIPRIKRPALGHFRSEADADDPMELCQVGNVSAEEIAAMV